MHPGLSNQTDASTITVLNEEHMREGCRCGIIEMVKT